MALCAFMAVCGSPVYAAENTASPRPVRVVALAPNLAELTADLGAVSQLVGRSLHSDYPDSIRHLPVVGSYYRPNLEHILALQPDLCLAILDGTPTDIVEKLRTMRIPVLLLNPQSLAGLEQTFTILGEALGRRQEAVAANARLHSLVARLQELRTNCRAASSPAVLLVLQENPLIVSAKGGYLDELIALAGGVNPVVAPMPYPRIAAEAVLQHKPAVVFKLSMHEWTQEALFVSAAPDPILWPHAKVYALDPSLFTRPSLRSLEAAQALVPLLCQPSPTVPTGQTP